MSNQPEKQGVSPLTGYAPPVHSRFKSGQSGNPGGVKKGTVFVSEAYKRLGSMLTADLRKYEPKNAVEAAVKAAILRAIDATDWQAAHSAMKELADRIDGKAVQHKILEVIETQQIELQIVIQLIAVARVEGRELDYDGAVAELERTREMLEIAQERELIEMVAAELAEEGSFDAMRV